MDFRCESARSDTLTPLQLPKRSSKTYTHKTHTHTHTHIYIYAVSLSLPLCRAIERERERERLSVDSCIWEMYGNLHKFSSGVPDLKLISVTQYNLLMLHAFQYVNLNISQYDDIG